MSVRNWAATQGAFLGRKGLILWGKAGGGGGPQSLQTFANRKLLILLKGRGIANPIANLSWTSDLTRQRPAPL